MQSTLIPSGAPVHESGTIMQPRQINEATAQESDAGSADRAAADRSAGETSAEVADLDEFTRGLLEAGIMGNDELTGESAGVLTIEGVPGLSHALQSSGRLTAYQADALCQRKSHSLVIGNYLILDKLGAGGMGTVFKARHRRLGRIVALKVLPPWFARDRTAVRRFKREVEAAGRLAHPNIVAALDADQDQGADFLVMEYVDGHDLNQLVRQGGPLSVEQAIDVLTQAARGLEAAHAAGIVHRDIKPSNLILDRRGVVRVLDLGLARIVDASLPFGNADSASARLTESGTYLGTVDYMAPEQAEDARQADHRADIYSLGCTLFFLLCGREPFAAETVLKRIFAHQELPAPSLRAERLDVPVPMEEAYQKMMAKRPLDRPGSMSAVIAILEAVKTVGRSPTPKTPQAPSEHEQPVKSSPAKRERGPFRWPGRPVKILALGSIGLLGATLVGLSIFRPSRGPAAVASVPIEWTGELKVQSSLNARLEARNQAILAKLDQEIRMDFPEGIALNDLLKYIRQSTSPPFPGIPIYVDPLGLQELEKHFRMTVKIDEARTTLKAALPIVLGQLGLDYVVSEGVLIISSPQQIDAERKRKVILSADDSPKTRILLEKLLEPISMSFREKTSLNDVLKYIRVATTTPSFGGVGSFLDPVGLREVERSVTARVMMIDFEGVPVMTSLRLILDQLGLVYAVKDGKVIISSPNRIRQLQAKERQAS